MALSKFKYVGGKDTGVNADKSKTLYNIQFPLGKDVEVPDDLVHKLRQQPEFVEVSSSVEKTEVEKRQEAEAKEAAKAAKAAPEKLKPEEIEDLKAKAAREDARVEKIQSDAKLGR